MTSKKQESIHEPARAQKRFGVLCPVVAAIVLLTLSGSQAAAQEPETKYSVLYNFCSQPNCADGADPSGGVIRDEAGNLYGTTSYGGRSGAGVVFKLDPSEKETVLYNFTGGADGGNPNGSLIRDEAGNLYGTAGGGSSGAGVVFKLDRERNETVLYSFCSQTNCADGAGPNSLIRDERGNLYGTTQDGGVSCPLETKGCGVVFKLDPAGKETVLYSFCSQTHCVDGAFPGVLIRDERGNLYGTAQYGAYGSGVVFRLDPSGTETVLYSFCSQTDCADGDYPTDLIRAEHGSLYGTTAFGGNSNCTFGFPPPPFGCGMVFKLDRSGRETVLYSFTAADGAFPDSLTLGDGDRWNPAGNLYGAAEGGGNLSSPICDQFGGEGCGVVFELDRWGKERVLHIFQGPDGMSPRGLLTYHDSLYGITAYGGPAIGEGNAGAGVIFKIKLDDDNDHDHEIDH